MIEVTTKNHEKDWQRIRKNVFMEEQGFENEFDELDAIAHHVVLYVNTIAVGCGRTYFDETTSKWHLGRLAIVKEYRKLGLGAVIIEHLEAFAISQKGTEMVLSAQEHAIPFYQKQGYEPYGDIYLDEHVPHLAMRKHFDKERK